MEFAMDDVSQEELNDWYHYSGMDCFDYDPDEGFGCIVDSDGVEEDDSLSEETTGPSFYVHHDNFGQGEKEEEEEGFNVISERDFDVLSIWSMGDYDEPT